MKNTNKLTDSLLKQILTDRIFWITLVISAPIAFLGNGEILKEARVAVGSSLIEMSAALLGIIIASLAIFVVFLDRKYIKLIQKYFNIESQLMPFKVTAILAILCLIFGMILIIIGEPCSWIFRFFLFGALWSFLYLLAQIYEVVKFLAEHTKARARQIEIDEEENQD